MHRGDPTSKTTIDESLGAGVARPLGLGGPAETVCAVDATQEYRPAFLADKLLAISEIVIAAGYTL
jgi:hypothetical protein